MQFGALGDVFKTKMSPINGLLHTIIEESNSSSSNNAAPISNNHFSDIESDEFKTLSEGQKVEFAVWAGDKDPSAKSVKPL